MSSASRVGVGADRLRRRGWPARGSRRRRAGRRRGPRRPPPRPAAASRWRGRRARRTTGSRSRRARVRAASSCGLELADPAARPGSGCRRGRARSPASWRSVAVDGGLVVAAAADRGQRRAAAAAAAVGRRRPAAAAGGGRCRRRGLRAAPGAGWPARAGRLARRCRAARRPAGGPAAGLRLRPLGAGAPGVPTALGVGRRRRRPVAGRLARALRRRLRPARGHHLGRLVVGGARPSRLVEDGQALGRRRRRWTRPGRWLMGWPSLHDRPRNVRPAAATRPGSGAAGGPGAQTPRNRLIASRCAARSSASRTPRPSSGARQSTPTLPWWRLWCTS